MNPGAPFMPPPPASTLAMTRQNTSAWRRSIEDLGVGQPDPPTLAGMRNGGPYRDLDEVTKGLGLPAADEAQLRKGLEAAGRGPYAVLNAVTGPLRELRQSTRDPQLVAEVGRRFAAMLGNGLVKAVAGEDDLVKAAMANQPPPGFTPISGSKHGGYHQPQGGGKYLYWYPGVGVTTQHRENMPAPGIMSRVASAAQGAAQAVVGGVKDLIKPGTTSTAQARARQTDDMKAQMYGAAMQQGTGLPAKPAPQPAAVPGAPPVAKPAAAPQQQPVKPGQTALDFSGTAAPLAPATPPKSGTLPAPDPNAPPPVDQLTGMPIAEWKTKSKAEQAQKTAKFTDVAEAMRQYDPLTPYDALSKQQLWRSVSLHVRQLQDSGAFSGEAAGRVLDVAQTMTDHAVQAGLDPQAIGDLMAQNMSKLALQEACSTERTIGDHGVRHITINVTQSHKILDALKAGGLAQTPLDYLMAAQVMVDHDLGYTIPAIHHGGFAVGDKFHPQASRLLWEQQAGMGQIFGKENAAKMAGWIEEHAGSTLDWKGDAIGSATNLADNTHLFADKMPEVLYDNKKGLELMAKLAVLKTAQGGLKGKAAAADPKVREGVESLKQALIAHLDSRTDIAPGQRVRLQKAAQEISANTDEFLASRLAGRSPVFAFDAKQGCMDVEIQHSSARGAIAQVFGEDEQDRQFGKMLTDFGIPQTQQDQLHAPPPPTKVGIPSGGDQPQATFTWKAGGEDPTEKAYGDVAMQVQKEWQGIQQQAEGSAKEAARQAFFGSLTKSLLALARA